LEVNVQVEHLMQALHGGQKRLERLVDALAQEEAFLVSSSLSVEGHAVFILDDVARLGTKKLAEMGG